MAAKRSRVDGSSSNSDENSDESMAEEEALNKEIQVDFEAVTPTDSDFHGIKRLLQQLFLKAHIDLTELTDLIIKQNYVCSVVKQNPMDDGSENDDDENEAFAMISVVNMTDKKELQCIKQICNLLIDHCKEANSEEQKLRTILDHPHNHVGLLLSERFINIPPQIALPLYENLKLDMQKALEKKMAFDFSYFLMISKIHKPAMKKKGKKKSDNDEYEIIFSNAEEELFSEEAEFQFDYSVAGELDTGLTGKWSDDDAEWKPYRRVLLINASKWDCIMQKLKAALS